VRAAAWGEPAAVRFVGIPEEHAYVPELAKFPRQRDANRNCDAVVNRQATVVTVQYVRDQPGKPERIMTR
jgi:hypothetical protein